MEKGINLLTFCDSSGLFHKQYQSIGAISGATEFLCSLRNDMLEILNDLGMKLNFLISIDWKVENSKQHGVSLLAQLVTLSNLIVYGLMFLLGIQQILAILLLDEMILRT